MTVQKIAGKEAIIYFDSKRCIHSRNCVLGRPDVFVPNIKGDWIFPDRASIEEIAEIAHNCPSGAIYYQRVDGQVGESAPKVNTVRVRENGPLAFHAPIIIDGKDQGYRLTFCRCGHSKNKPYCDGQHAAENFIATGEPPTKESAPLVKRDGVLEITEIKDGPLRAAGNQEVVTGTGKTINRAEETFICRCGQSKNKPYCDGSHKAAGFQAGGITR
ncbi:MAG: CDGSH iron-sulfur domain-containing protein [Burkholderiales bacterium]|jgi:CDGSH-type Zn-finger protein/uncharacterized Fe-S cluster protein YjdI|nr:CDGSH iron-sulfur domain-containing protein [Burkholderiales bacterium]